MKKGFWKYYAMPAIMLLAMGITGIWGAVNVWSNVHYSGKFNATHEQYEQFKVAVTNPNYNIGKLYVMNSEPVYIEFAVSVPSNEAFPFGERDELGRILLFSIIIGFALASFIGSGRAIREAFKK